MTSLLGFVPQIEDSPDRFVGQIIDGYRIDKRIGQGGMGVVYRARNQESGEIVAVKVLAEKYALEPAYRRRFHREANSCSKLKHDGLVRVYKHMELPNGDLCLIMEYINGDTLGSHLKRASNNRFSIENSVIITELVAEAMSIAHQTQIVHLDLKPENIMLRSSGDSVRKIWPVVLDFGIARFLGTDSFQTNPQRSPIGTPAYMSPEQCQGDADVNQKSDVYALGCILYEMLCGQPPFAASPSRLLLLHSKQKPRKPRLRNRSIPVSLEQLILDMLQKEPEMRPSMAEVSERCRQIRARCSGPFWLQYRPWLASFPLILILGVWVTANRTKLLGTRLDFLGQKDGQGAQLRSRLEVQGSLSDAARVALIGHATDAITAGNEVRHGVPNGGGSTDETAGSENSLHNAAIDGGSGRDDGGAVDMSPHWPFQGPMRIETGQRETGARRSSLSSKGHQCQLQLQLERQPSQADSTRILINGRTERPVNLPSSALHDDGWFSSATNTLEVDFSDAWVKDVEIVIEMRDRYGCFVAVGSQTLSRDESCNSKINVALGDPLISGYTYLKVNKRVPGDSKESQVGTIVVDELNVSHGQRPSLIECGERCACAVQSKARLRISALGSEYTPFSGFLIPACRGQNSNPCEVSVDELPSHEIRINGLTDRLMQHTEHTIEGRFHYWKVVPGFPSARELEPPLIRLSQRQQNFYLERKKHWSSAADFANPAHLRSVHGLSDNRVYIAGFGGTLTVWSRDEYSLLTQQVGEYLDDGYNDNKIDELLHGRLTDFHAIRELSDHSVVAAGSDESLVNSSIRESSRIWHLNGQGWKPVQFYRIEDTPNKTPVTMPRILSISDADTLDDVLLGGLDSFSLHRRWGRISQIVNNRHIWAIARRRTDGQFWLVGGGRDNPNYAESMLLSYVPRVGLVRLQTGYDNAYRAIWLSRSSDGDIWIAGMPSQSGSPAVERFRVSTDRDGTTSIKSVFSCERGDLPPQVFGLWGTSDNDVWAAGKDRIVHCNGVEPWRVMYRSSESNVELVALWGLSSGEVWAVGFVRTPSPRSVDEGQTDHSIIIRIPHA